VLIAPTTRSVQPSVLRSLRGKRLADSSPAPKPSIPRVAAIVASLGIESSTFRIVVSFARSISDATPRSADRWFEERSKECSNGSAQVQRPHTTPETCGPSRESLAALYADLLVAR